MPLRNICNAALLAREDGEAYVCWPVTDLPMAWPGKVEIAALNNLISVRTLTSLCSAIDKIGPLNAIRDGRWAEGSGRYTVPEPYMPIKWEMADWRQATCSDLDLAAAQASPGFLKRRKEDAAAQWRRDDAYEKISERMSKGEAVVADSFSDWVAAASDLAELADGLYRREAREVSPYLSKCAARIAFDAEGAIVSKGYEAAAAKVLADSSTALYRCERCGKVQIQSRRPKRPLCMSCIKFDATKRKMALARAKSRTLLGAVGETDKTTEAHGRERVKIL